MHRSVGTLTIGRNGIEHATALREPNSAKLPFAFDERIKEIFLEHSNQTKFILLLRFWASSYIETEH